MAWQGVKVHSDAEYLFVCKTESRSGVARCKVHRGCQGYVVENLGVANERPSESMGGEKDLTEVAT